MCSGWQASATCLQPPQATDALPTHPNTDKLVINQLWIRQPRISCLTAQTVNKSSEQRSPGAFKVWARRFGLKIKAASSLLRGGGVCVRREVCVRNLQITRLCDSLYCTNKCLKALAYHPDSQECFSFISPRSIPLSLCHTPPICWE